MATYPDGYVLLSVSEAVSLYTSVAGEHGWEAAHVLLVGFPLMSGWPLCEQNARQDGPLV